MNRPFEPPAALAALPVRERVSSRARKLRIEIRPGGEIWLIIPQGISRARAYAFLAERADWARRHATRLQTQIAAPMPLRFDGTDRIPLRGIDTPLRVLLAPALAVRVATDDIALAVPPQQLADRTALERALGRALRETARADTAAALSIEASRLDIGYHGPRIADQRSRWGSCSAGGLISLNWRLVMAPAEVLRYVVVHELCHRRHHDHSPRFWRLVARQMPGFESPRRWLRLHGTELSWILPRPA
ncbi:MAG: M48 family metallopeptidase [Gammaproteobacteria bacterium]|nr:M48 family metallopeptidase [Gammaproteobacteria bacterium]